jgi:hypothetical protein
LLIFLLLEANNEYQMGEGNGKRKATI